MFFNWIEKYHSDFTLIKAYHGSAPETPIALVYNGFTYNPSDDSTSHYEYEDCSSYSVSLDSLEKIIKDVKDFNLFSMRTMPEELFSYLDERGYFSLQYLNCSS